MEELVGPQDVALWIEEPEQEERKKVGSGYCCDLAVPLDVEDRLINVDDDLWTDFIGELNEIVPYVSSESTWLEGVQIVLFGFFCLLALVAMFGVPLRALGVLVPLLLVFMFVLILSMGLVRHCFNATRDRKLRKVCLAYAERFEEAGYCMVYKCVPHVSQNPTLCALFFSSRCAMSWASSRSNNKVLGDARVVVFTGLRHNAAAENPQRGARRGGTNRISRESEAETVASSLPPDNSDRNDLNV